MDKKYLYGNTFLRWDELKRISQDDFKQNAMDDGWDFLCRGQFCLVLLGSDASFVSVSRPTGMQ